MRFVSTRGGEEVSFREAIFAGLAPNGGLYVPAGSLDLRGLFASFNRGTAFRQIAAEVSLRLLADELGSREIERIVEGAFGFAPALRSLGDGRHLLELFHGPTAAFKDFGASFLAAAMEEFLGQEERRALILVATSGDTGGAVARAFFRKRNIRVVILYPSGRVSSLQEQQLTTLGENITALEVRGSFDDCQRLVKQAFMDPVLKRDLALTSANSINLGRLIPQSYYYIYAWAQLRSGPGEKVIFCVPSGNFGNLTAGVYSWQWGLPVSAFIAATNLNDAVPRYLASGRFRPRPSRRTLSNAMDVGNPSNFERLAALFRQDSRAMAALIRGERVTDRQTRRMIRKAYLRDGVVVDPHTAVGLEAVERLQRRSPRGADPIVILATAHPGKFREIVEPQTRRSVELPETLRESQGLPKRSVPIGATFAELAAFLRRSYSCL